MPAHSCRTRHCNAASIPGTRRYNPPLRPEARGCNMAGIAIGVFSFILMFLLIRSVEQRIGELDLARLPVALIIPLIASAAVAFPTTIIESASLRGWLSAAVHLVIMFLMLWKYAGFPASRSVSYTGAGVIINTVIQSIWFYWLVDF